MQGRGLVEFEELQQAYFAIKDLDAVIASDSQNKLDDAWNVISDVSKDKFDSELVSSIINNIREALVLIFKEKEAAINASISITL